MVVYVYGSVGGLVLLGGIATVIFFVLQRDRRRAAALAANPPANTQISSANMNAGVMAPYGGGGGTLQPSGTPMLFPPGEIGGGFVTTSHTQTGIMNTPANAGAYPTPAVSMKDMGTPMLYNSPGMTGRFTPNMATPPINVVNTGVGPGGFVAPGSPMMQTIGGADIADMSLYSAAPHMAAPFVGQHMVMQTEPELRLYDPNDPSTFPTAAVTRTGTTTETHAPAPAYGVVSHAGQY